MPEHETGHQPEPELSKGQERYRDQVADEYSGKTGEERQDYFNGRRNADIKNELIEQDWDEALAENQLRDEAREFAQNLHSETATHIADSDAAQDEAMSLYAEAAEIAEANTLEHIRADVLAREERGEEWSEDKVAEAAVIALRELREKGPDARSLDAAAEYLRGQDSAGPEGESAEPAAEKRSIGDRIRDYISNRIDQTEARRAIEAARAESAAERAEEAGEREESREQEQRADSMLEKFKRWLKPKATEAWQSGKDKAKDAGKRRATSGWSKIKRAAGRAAKVGVKVGIPVGIFAVAGPEMLVVAGGGYLAWRILSR